MKNNRKSKLASGMVMGMAIGAVIGIALDNIGVWISIGLVFGAGVGKRLSNKEEEENNNWRYISMDPIQERSYKLLCQLA